MGRRRSGYRPGRTRGEGEMTTEGTVTVSATDEASAPEQDHVHHEPPKLVAYVLDVLARYWACTAIVLGVIVSGLVTGAFWRGVDEGSELHDRFAYGLPAL